MSKLGLRAQRTGVSEASPVRPLVALAQALFLFESALYSALTPVLPHYAHSLGLSKPAVGVLAAAYSAGLVPGSVLGAWMAARVGVRRTTLVGLVGFAGTVAAFGFGANIVVLDLLRAAQGAACGCIWGGALTWVIAVAPRNRRGEVLGSVIGAAVSGTLLGPLLGILAVSVGTKLVFSLIGCVSLALAAWVMAHPEPARSQPVPRAPLVTLLRSGPLVLGVWLLTLEAIAIGATNVLLPLRLAGLGASGVAIGATFLLAAGVRALLAPFIGRVSDRRGAGAPLGVGLSLAAFFMIVLPLPRSALAVAVVSVLALGGPLLAFMIPAISLVTDAAERLGIGLAVATMLFNLTYAIGETIGAPAAAGLAQVTGDGVPFIGLAALMLLTLGAVLAYERRSATSARPSPAPSATGR